VPCLINTWYQIGDSQFYDKFNVRHAIALLMKYLLGHPKHLKRIETEMSLNIDQMLKFANCLMNDMIYLFDEAIKNAMYVVITITLMML
jgi:hypothetical protein